MCNIDMSDIYVSRVKIDFNSLIDDKHYAHCKMIRERKYNNKNVVKMDREYVLRKLVNAITVLSKTSGLNTVDNQCLCLVQDFINDAINELKTHE